MRTTLRSTALLVYAFTLSAASLQAQTDPLNASASQTQPNQPGHVQSPTTSLLDSSGPPSDTIQEMKDKIFLRKATEGGLAQVQLGQLASTNAISPEVKQLGQKLADDHTKLNASMAAVADSIGMKLPRNLNKADQAEYEKLKALSGEDFDREYLACMVRDHHEDLRAFRVESRMTTDPEVKAMVDQGTRVLHEHLTMVSRLAMQNGVPLPIRGGKPPATPPTQ